MPSHCAVASCKLDTTIAKRTGEKVSLFRFPKNAERRRDWIVKCKRRGTFNVNNSRICSRHFSEDDFERDIRAEVMNVPARLTLKENAIPSINLTSSPSKVTGHRRNRLNNRNAVKEAKEIVEEALNARALELSLEKTTIPHVVNTKEMIIRIPPVLNSDYQNLNQKAEKLAEQNESLQCLLAERNAEIKRYRKAIHSLKTQLRATQKRDISNKYAVAMTKLFTPCQRKLLLGKQMVQWEENDIAQAFTLRHLSRSAYIYLRNQLKYPLPGLSTLTKWASKYNIQHPLLQSMDITDVTIDNS